MNKNSLRKMLEDQEAQEKELFSPLSVLFFRLEANPRNESSETVQVSISKIVIKNTWVNLKEGYMNKVQKALE